MTETYKPKKKTKGLGLKKGQSLQLSQEIVKDRNPATLDNLKSNVVAKAVWTRPSKGPSLSQEALSKISKVIGPYSDKLKGKAKLQGQVVRRNAKRFSRTSQGRQSALLLLGGGLTALLKKLQDAKESNQKEVKVGGARFTIKPIEIDPVAEYKKQSNKDIKKAQDRIHGR